MPTSTTYNMPYWNSGDLMIDLRQRANEKFWAAFDFGVTPPSLAPVTIYGVQGAALTETDTSGNVITQNFLLMTLLEDETIDARSLIANAGFAGVYRTAVEPTADPLWTLDNVFDVWALYWLESMRDLIEAWVSGSSVDLTAVEVEPITDLVRISTATLVITSPSDVCVVSEQMWAADSEDTGGNTFWVENAVTYTGPRHTPNTTLQIQQLTEAVQDVADMNVDFSINHGQSIFSVRSKTYVGS